MRIVEQVTRRCQEDEDLVAFFNSGISVVEQSDLLWDVLNVLEGAAALAPDPERAAS